MSYIICYILYIIELSILLWKRYPHHNYLLSDTATPNGTIENDEFYIDIGRMAHHITITSLRIPTYMA